jgi:hypothetical protein
MATIACKIPWGLVLVPGGSVQQPDPIVLKRSGGRYPLDQHVSFTEIDDTVWATWFSQNKINLSAIVNGQVFQV